MKKFVEEGNFLSVQDVIGRVKYGTHLVIVDEATGEEAYNGVYSFDVDLEDVCGEKLMDAEVTLITTDDAKLMIKVLFNEITEEDDNEPNRV